MSFKSMDELKLWVKRNNVANFDGGSQGECFKIGDKVYKIFNEFIDEEYDEIITYNKDDIMQFSSIKNNTYIWPDDIIMVGDTVVGYIMDYVDAKSLHKINPLIVNLNKLEKSLEKSMNDVKIISDNGVLSFDVTYNILYGRSGLKVIDSVEYSKTGMDSAKLYEINKERFYYEIRLFLIDGYFDDFVFNSNYLYGMCYDPEVDFIYFLREFRKMLSENEGFEISKLGDAKNSMVIKKSREPKYIREFRM